MTQRRPLHAVESSPTTSPPSYDKLRRLRNAIDPTDPTEDTPYGITVGPTFPATPSKYHRHLLMTGDTSSTEEWFFWDQWRNGGAGRWVSERQVTMLFTLSGGVTNGPLNFPSVGTSGNTVGYASGGRPLVLIRSHASQAVSGGDSGLRVRLRSSLSATEIAFTTLAADLTKDQDRRDNPIPTLGANERFWCDVSGTIGAGAIVQWVFRRTES